MYAHVTCHSSQDALRLCPCFVPKLLFKHLPVPTAPSLPNFLPFSKFPLSKTDNWMKRGFLKNNSITSPSSCIKHDVDVSRATNPANKPREPLKIPLIPDYDAVPYLEQPGTPGTRSCWKDHHDTFMIPTPLPFTVTGTELSLLYP